VFERFTEPAQRAVAFAQEEAARLGHAYVDPEHLLLGIVRSGVPVANELGLDAGDLRSLVSAALGPGIGRPGTLALSPAAHAVVERALLVELEMGDHRIGPEHLLHALAQQPEAMALLDAADCPPHVVLAALGHS
jgi:ATP-dependent Clp protease ATP-binding subunit ClpC